MLYSLEQTQQNVSQICLKGKLNTLIILLNVEQGLTNVEY